MACNGLISAINNHLQFDLIADGFIFGNQNDWRRMFFLG